MQADFNNRGDLLMRVPCVYCGEPLTSNSRHQEHAAAPVVGSVSHLFSSYAHCSNCGATTVIKFELMAAREPKKLTQEDLFNLCA